MQPNYQFSLKNRQLGVYHVKDQTIAVIWAPKAKQLEWIFDTQIVPMTADDNGFWQASTARLAHGTFYKFRFYHNENESELLPDPHSLWQPHGIFGPSAVVDFETFAKFQNHFVNIRRKELILYELHIGTFSHTGDFDGTIRQLPHLVQLGINAISIMPVAAFPGQRNWGYDGVYPFAVQQEYGGPEGLSRLVDACHKVGIAVILDVVYNHLGPEGNYLETFGYYFTDAFKTPWGKAINFEGSHSEPVRAYFIENALHWLRDYGIDGLRLDAVHEIKDYHAVHFLAQLSDTIEKLSTATGKPYHLIMECDLNDPKYLKPLAENGKGIHLQWNDDFHHALRVSAGEPQQHYYQDYRPLTDLAKVMSSAYIYDGVYSEFRKKIVGDRSYGLEDSQFVVYNQNHDQIGNRLKGERPLELYGFSMQKLMAGIVLLSPFIPQLFMGEEIATQTPFLFFADHQSPKLRDIVRKGRQAEFAHQGTAPDPFDEQTFLQSKLDWDSIEAENKNQILRYYQRLIELRKAKCHLIERHRIQTSIDTEKSMLSVCYQHNGIKRIVLANFSKTQQNIPNFSDAMTILIDSAAAEFGGQNQQSGVIQPHTLILLEEHVI